MKNLIVDFLARHQNPFNIALHVIGVPLVFYGVFLLFKRSWKTAAICIFTGYLIQYLGHLLIERNQMGEIALIEYLIKKITG